MANSPNGCLPEHKAKRMFHELVSVLAKMHELGFVHRDIMLSNIFLREGQVIRVGDLGSATKYKGTKMQVFNGNQGTIAPEMFLCKLGLCQDGYTEKIDVYSLGVLFFWLICGSPLFDIKKVADCD